jgi:hypothetical protein
MEKLPIYKLSIDPDVQDDSGVDYVALVDMPAIERNWVAFNEVKPMKFSIDNEEKRIVSGPLMVADLPIYRRDEALGEYYAVFDSNTIMQIVQKFFKNKYNTNVNIMHSSSDKVEGVFMFESFIINRDRGIHPPSGFDGLTDGSWFGSYKVENDEVWNDIKAGTFKGFSVEGPFIQELFVEKPVDKIQEIIDIIDSITTG